MEQRDIKSMLPPSLAAILAGITLQYCALSLLDVVEEFLRELGLSKGRWDAALALSVIGFVSAAFALVAAKALKRHLDATLRSSGYGVSGSLLDTDLAKKLPTREYWVIMLALAATVLLFLCSMHWAAHGTWELLVHGAHLNTLTLALLAAVATLGLTWLWRTSVHPEASHEQGTPGQFEALVLFLSSPGFNALPHAAKKYKDPDSPMTTAEFLADFDDLMLRQLQRMPVTLGEVKKRFGKNSWAIPVWSIATVAQKGALRHVVLIGSKGAGDFQATRDLAKHFADVLTKVMGDDAPNFHLWPPAPETDGINLEDFAVLRGTLGKVHAFLEKVLKDSPTKRIGVDVTGGTKLCTIAGLVSTLRPGLNALYVSTSSLQITAHDVQYVNPADEPFPPEVPSLH